LGLLPVIQVGGDLGAKLHELKLGLGPLHEFPPFWSPLRLDGMLSEMAGPATVLSPWM
jgi:hypothetical protein